MSKWKQDLTGKRFGLWTVLGRSEKQYYWRCRCDCGAVHDVWYSGLTLGNSNGCQSCINKANMRKVVDARIGQKYGRLTLKKAEVVDGTTLYTCQCDCGNTCRVAWGNISNGKTSSCGCIRKERGKKETEKLLSYKAEIIEKNCKDGTLLSGLTQKLSKNSKTGIKGVSMMKDGKYRAYISLQRKQIHLGVFDTLEEAAEARKEGEEKYYDPILTKHGRKE